MPDTNTHSTARRRPRRGSALIITVGTLALIAVIAAVYVTLGRSDSRAAEAVERGSDLASIEEQITEYIARVVAEDRLAVTVETVTADETEVGWGVDRDGNRYNENAVERQRFIRAATDYPYTDYSYKSVFEGFNPTLYLNVPDPFTVGRLSEAIERFRFNPVGEHRVMLDLPGAESLGLQAEAMLRDYRVASDPWLASSEPEFLGRPESGEDIDQRIFSQQGALLSDVSNEPLAFHYLDNRDWRQISNLAPDGLSVNLWNLRGNFAAEPGLGVDPSGRARMSENRTLLSIANPGSAGPDTPLIIRASDRLHINPEVPVSILDFTPESFAIKNTPAWWTMNQRFLYFPADPEFPIRGRRVETDRTFTTVQTPAHPDYPDYQYADADGDGFYDSRWFELTDATLGALGTKSLLNNRTDMRFFIAARAVDLSGRVNVNSATDGLVPGTGEVPPGATPAEIDLRRLLTMQDVSERYRPVFENTSIPNPSATTQRLSYSHIRRLPETERQVNAGNRVVSGDYEQYLTIRPATDPFLAGAGLMTGRFAYDAIRREIQGDGFWLSPDSTSRRSFNVNQTMLDTTPFEYYDFTPGSGIYDLEFVSPAPDRLAAMARARRDYWHDVGGANIADPNDPPITATGMGGRLFDLEDLVELLTFNGLNDDSKLSRLERATQGRYDESPGGITNSALRFGPLRANRPTDLERRNHDRLFNSNGPDAMLLTVGDGVIDYESMALAALDPRRRLTTISGASPLRSHVVQDVNRDGRLSKDERRLTAADARLDLLRDGGDAAALFSIYADALAPYARASDSWNSDPSGEVLSRSAFNRMRTLAYGHRGSELALRVSAHLAVNMADLHDDDDVPSAYTVMAAPWITENRDNGPRDLIENDLLNSLGQAHHYQWWIDDKRFDLGDDALAPTVADVGGDLSRAVYNVYGFEPQPFITEVAVMTVYCDVPRIALNGDPGFTGPDMSGQTNESGPAGEDPGPYAGPNENPSPESDSFGICGVINENSPNLGQDDDEIDDVSIRTDIAPNNPDLLLHVLAVQLTNPFDVEINLTDMVEGDIQALKGRPVTQPGETRLDDIKYYIEFNGHFFPLAEFVENAGRTLNLFDQDGQMHRVVLAPGESRVFYVSAHPNLSELTSRWQSVELVYSSAGSGVSGIFDAALSGVNAPQSRPFIVEEFIETQLSVREHKFDYEGRVPPARLVPFNPTNGELAREAFVDFMRTSRAFRDVGTGTLLDGTPADKYYDRMRQEVRLWRKLTVDNPERFSAPVQEDTDFNTATGVGTGQNWIENDLLVDRLRDPMVPSVTTPLASTTNESTLDYATLTADFIQQFDPAADFPVFFNATPYTTPERVLRIPETTATFDVEQQWSNTNQGITAVLATGYRRPDHLERFLQNEQIQYWHGVLNDKDGSPRGLLPAWCMEGNDANHNISHPAVRGGDPLAGIEAWKGMLSEIRGTWFGFNGCHREDGFGGAGFPVPGGDIGGMFFKNPIRFMRTVLHDVSRVNDDGDFTNDTWVNVDGDEPLLIATMTAHPALKHRRVADPDDDDTGEQTPAGVPLDMEDPFDLIDAYEQIDRVVGGVSVQNMQFSDKRTPVLLGRDRADDDARVASDLETLVVNNADGFGYDGVRAATRAIRLGDLVLPPAVGPAFAPGTTAVSPANFMPRDWTTMAEAMSAAMGFEPPEFYNADPPANPLNQSDQNYGYSLLNELVSRRTPNYDDLNQTTPIEEIEFILDRGRLDLNAYTPFYNFILDGERAFFRPAQPGAGDHRVGLSIPPAQRLLSMAQPVSRGGDPLTTPVIGTVNINTAPDAVLRTIPGFATSLQFSQMRVDYDQYDVGGINSPQILSDLMEWPAGRVAGKVVGAYTDFAGLIPIRPLPFGIGDPFTTSVDNFGDNVGWKHTGEIAAHLAAFRDRSTASMRAAAASPTNILGQRASVYILNSTPNPGIIAGWFGNDVFSGTFPPIREIHETNFAFDLGRGSLNNEIASIERPGLDGTGRLLGLTIARTDPLFSTNPRFVGVFGNMTDEQWHWNIWDRSQQATITRHGTDGLAMAAKDQDWRGDRSPGGVLLAGFDTPYYYDPDIYADPDEDDNFAYTLGRGLFHNDNPDTTRRRRGLEDELADDILEKLAVFNGAAATVDVRSDFFAVWFIIRGYRETDVMPLDEGQPMTPTYQKRFLMVLDRTNVTESGQLPNILFLREVPL